MPQQKDIVKIAIQMPGAYPQLIQLDQKKPLTAVIKEVCDKWNLPGPDNYALQYADGIQTYITESGRCAEDLYKGIQSSDSGVRCDSLKLLADVSTDITFAQEFISRDGHSLLVKIVEDAHEAPLIMTHTLTAFMELMDHGIVSWENLSSVFIKKIAGFVNAKVLDTSIQQVSLAILESMVLSSSSLFNEVKQEITLERLISHLQVTNQQLQTKAMALLMAMLQAGGEADRQELFCICIQLLNKTWKEMRATQEDFDKVDHHLHHLSADRDFFTSSLLSLCWSALTETKLYFTLFIAYFLSEIHL
uniref:Engulfment and cell motility protein 2-like n=1 Tax=Sinocyclocheilus grahami TaxID=75366 RepID=A0A672QW97_SINGR